MRQLDYSSVILILLKSYFHLAAFGEASQISTTSPSVTQSAPSTTLQTLQHVSPATRLQHSMFLTTSAQLTV